jgi:hypothetical protein
MKKLNFNRVFTKTLEVKSVKSIKKLYRNNYTSL